MSTRILLVEDDERLAKLTAEYLRKNEFEVTIEGRGDTAEARILKLDVNLRPALPDHHPQVQVEPGLIRINGLYRHGWLLAPALLSQALQQAGLRSLLNETTP